MFKAHSDSYEILGHFEPYEISNVILILMNFLGHLKLCENFKVILSLRKF